MENSLKTVIERNEFLNREVCEDINEINEDIKSNISNYPKSNEDILIDCYNSLFNQNLKIIIAKYTLYKRVENIRLFLDTIKYMDKSWGQKSSNKFVYHSGTTPYFSYDEYWKLITMLSFCVLLDVPNEEFTKLVKIREKVQEKDYLLDTIIASRINDYKVDKHNMKTNPYQELVNIINVAKEGDDFLASEMLKTYLSTQWYKDNKEMYWYNYHKEKGLYFGYWSFESGAIAKILSLDDSSLKNQKYYPYDMVHFKE